MAGEIERASERLDERKQAIDRRSAEAPATVSKEQGLAIFSGFDLNPAELHEVEDFIGTHCLLMIARGIHPENAIASVFADGLAIGLLIAEEREKAAQS